MVESGIEDFVTVSFFGLVARAGTPADIVAKLSGAVNESLKAPDVEAALAKLSLDIRAGSSAEFSAFLDKERQKWSSIVRLAHIQVE
jgi:tripartite-type tricarboxylate transporter receptor subunit TctC